MTSTTVQVADLTRTVTIQPDTFEGHTSLLVKVTYDAPGLDRKDGTAWGLKAGHRALAERLVAAIEAGVILSEPVICTDINGATYVSVSSRILSRMMNAELTRLGF